MAKVDIVLDSIEKVEKFVSNIKAYECDFDLGSSRVMIDAKSILGILSLGLGQPLKLTIHKNDNIDDIMTSIAPFMV